MSDTPRLHHEDLDAYKAAIEVVAVAMAVAKGLPRGHSALADQLRRASWSIPLRRGKVLLVRVVSMLVKMSGSGV